MIKDCQISNISCVTPTKGKTMFSLYDKCWLLVQGKTRRIKETFSEGKGTGRNGRKIEEEQDEKFGS